MTESKSSSSGFQVKGARRQDCPAMKALNERVFPPREQYELAAWRKTVAEYQSAVALNSAGEVVGYGLVGLYPGSDAKSGTSEPGSSERSHVVSFCVAREVRRQGLGRRLLEWILAKLPTGRLLTLNVRPSNAAARALYRQMGFEEATRIETYYGDGEDALVFKRRV